MASRDQEVRYVTKACINTLYYAVRDLWSTHGIESRNIQNSLAGNEGTLSPPGA